MDFTAWYAVALGSCVAVIIGAKVTQQTLKLEFLGYRHVDRYLGVSGSKVRSALILLTLLIGNILGLTLYVHDPAEFIKRAGLLSIVNIAPLMLGGHINLVADRCGISLASYATAHRWLGRICIIESIIHAAARYHFFNVDFHKLQETTGLVAVIILVLVFFSGPLRFYLHESFMWTHVLSALAVAVLIYLHLPSRALLEIPAVYVLSALCLLTLTGAVQFLGLLCRNVRYGQPLSLAAVRLMSFKRPNENDITVTDAVRVDVRLSVPWQLRPGQYVYLCILRAGLTSFAQMHPFYVAWGYRDKDGHDHAVLIVEKQNGFTKKIVAHAHAAEAFSDCPKMKALIGGPYGQEMGLGFFGTVILFATGIGIAAQLPYISELLRDYSNNETRRIALFWQVESEVQTAWVADHMQELLSQDVNRILDIHLFVVGGFLSRNTRRGDIVSRGERIDVTYSAMDAREIIGAEMNGRKGRVVISLCVKDEINREIRRAVRQRPESSFHIKEIPFQPMDRKGYEDVLTALLKLARLLFVR